MLPIATLILVAKPEDMPEFKLTVEVGTPYYRGDAHEDWACPCSLYPLQPRLADAVGRDAFQALCMAISLIQYLLQAFLDDGGRLKTENGSDFTLEGYSFGVAIHPSARR